MNLSIGDLIGVHAGDAVPSLRVAMAAARAAVAAAVRERVLVVAQLVGNLRRRVVHGVRRLARAARRIGHTCTAALAVTSPRGPPAVI